MKILLACILAVQVFAQTQVNLSRQARKVDFGDFSGTKPWRVSATLPATCQTGEAVFITNAPPGQRLYLCGQTNSWETNALSSTSVIEFEPVKQSAATLSIGPSCSSLKPCRALLGERVITLSGPATITVSGVESTGVIYVWLDEIGVRAGGTNSGTLSCNALCTIVPGAVTTFPARTLPLAAVTYSLNVIDSVTGAMDFRSTMSAQKLEAGPSANLSMVSNTFTGATEVDLSDTLDFGGMTVTRVLRRGTAVQRPVSCSIGDLYYQIDGMAGIYECIVVNQWRGPLASVQNLAIMDMRLTALAQTGNAPSVTLLAAGHTAGLYRICSVTTIIAVGSGDLDLVLSWRSSAQLTDLTATTLSIPLNTTGQAYGCRLIDSTGVAAITLDASDAGSSHYNLRSTVERLQ